uniref:cyclin-H n=1 Tax=Myxine glutinosa TaxID=7769 RepID=UPI0035901935
MFHSGTQRKHWTFQNPEELEKLRTTANDTYKVKMKKNYKTSVDESRLLSRRDEQLLVQHYERRLQEFCNSFKPSMPRSVLGIACIYFKRFYLNNSVMDHNPRNMLLTCAYLACKVDEFNVSATQFVGNLKEDECGRERALELVLGSELLLIQELSFHLTVHTPYRPLEGLLIHLKTCCPSVEHPESLRKGTEEFLQRALSTDVGLLASPSQIALAALYFAASQAGVSLDSYISEILVQQDKDRSSHLMETIQKLEALVKAAEPPSVDDVNRAKQAFEGATAYLRSLGFLLGKRKQNPEVEEDPTTSKMAKCQGFSSDEELDL